MGSVTFPAVTRASLRNLLVLVRSQADASEFTTRILTTHKQK